MKLSYEWTDWHLTPEGWLKGDHKTDFKPVVRVAPPYNRLLTRRYIECIDNLCSPLEIVRKNIWSCYNVKEIKKYYRLFEYPNSLAVNFQVKILHNQLSQVS